jgi:hypothetical protein
MKRVISFSLGILITLCMIVGSERRAWGYVDPGSGLIALQGIASVAAAYAYYVRRRIHAFFLAQERAPRWSFPSRPRQVSPAKSHDLCIAGATFRDPAGSLSFEDDLGNSQGDASARAAVLDLLDSPFCRTLQERGDLIGAEVDDSGGSLSLRHPKIPIPTYPWEWTPSQWLAAAA